MKKLWLLLILSIIALYACPIEIFDDDGPVTGEELIKAQADTITTTQEAMLDMFDQALQTMDTVSAKQKLISDFSADPAIETIVESYEGLCITYKNGLKGVISLLDGKEEEPFKSDIILDERNEYNVPPAKKALYLITADTDINGPGEKLAVAAKAQLKKPGFNFEIVRGTNFNLHKLKNLEGYGIIHIWAHGGLFNKDKNDPYLCTDETFDKINHVSLLANQDAWNARQIGFSTKKVNGMNVHRFFVFPSFVTDNNNFSQDSTMVYGGFCYSALGDWKKIFTDANALTYFGYDWVIGAKTDENWMTDMYVQLSDTTRQLPVTLTDWFNASPRSYKSNKNPNPENSGHTLIQYWGHLNKAAFWKPEKKNDILRIDVDMYLEDASFRFVVDGSESFGNGAHRAFVSSREGTSVHYGDTYTTTFNKIWFGTEYSGTMKIRFVGNKVNVDITQVRKSGSCTSTFVISKYDLPFNSSEGAYYQSGISAQSALNTSFNKQCTATYEELNNYNHSANDYFRVDVVYN